MGGPSGQGENGEDGEGVKAEIARFGQGGGSGPLPDRGPRGRLMAQCRHCRRKFPSPQATRAHLKSCPKWLAKRNLPRQLPRLPTRQAGGVEHLLALHEALANFLLRGWDTLSGARTADLFGSLFPDSTPRLEPLGRPYLKLQAWGRAIEEMVKTRRIDWERLAGIYAEFPQARYKWEQAARRAALLDDEELPGGEELALPDGVEALQEVGQRLRALLALGPPATVLLSPARAPGRVQGSGGKKRRRPR